jgi:hypothetical protein
MKSPLPPRFVQRSLVSVFGLMSAVMAHATIADLNFTDGTGTSSVDQYTGTAGSGWSSAWSATFHSQTLNGLATLSSSAPLVSGGGNYLRVTYDTQATVTTSAIGRVARQWDSTAISLTSAVILQFDVRLLTDSGSANQTVNFFGSSTSASSTSSNDSWKISSSGDGWYVYNGTTALSLGTGQVKATDTWHFTVTIDAVADTYSVAAQNLTTSSILYTSIATLALRNGADSSLSWLNFNSSANASLTNRGFELDNVSVTSAIPEPSTAALLTGGAMMIGAILRRRRHPRT